MQPLLPVLPHTAEPPGPEYGYRNRKRSLRAKPSIAPHLRLDPGPEPESAEPAPRADQPAVANSAANPETTAEATSTAQASIMEPLLDLPSDYRLDDFLALEQTAGVASTHASSSGDRLSTPPPKRRAAAKMLIKVGLRCAQCYALKAECRCCQNSQASVMPTHTGAHNRTDAELTLLSLSSTTWLPVQHSTASSPAQTTNGQLLGQAGTVTETAFAWDPPSLVSSAQSVLHTRLPPLPQGALQGISTLSAASPPLVIAIPLLAPGMRYFLVVPETRLGRRFFLRYGSHSQPQPISVLHSFGPMPLQAGSPIIN